MSAVAPVAGAPSYALRWRWALGDVAVLTHRYLLRYARVPALVVFTAVQPVMFVLLFRYVFGGAIRAPGGSYVDYLIPGILVQTAAFGSFGTAIGLAEDLAAGVIDRFRSLPMTRSAVLVARLLADTVRNTFVVLLMLGVGYATGYRIHTGPLAALALVALAVVFGVAFLCVSAYVGLALKNSEAVQSFGMIWLFPLTFASGIFVPVATMPGWLQAFAKVNPATIAADALRDLTSGGPTATDVWQTLAWTAGIVAAFVPLAVRAYRRAG